MTVASCERLVLPCISFNKTQLKDMLSYGFTLFLTVQLMVYCDLSIVYPNNSQLQKRLYDVAQQLGYGLVVWNVIIDKSINLATCKSRLQQVHVVETNGNGPKQLKRVTLQAQTLNTVWCPCRHDWAKYSVLTTSS